MSRGRQRQTWRLQSTNLCFRKEGGGEERAEGSSGKYGGYRVQTCVSGRKAAVRNEPREAAANMAMGRLGEMSASLPTVVART